MQHNMFFFFPDVKDMELALDAIEQDLIEAKNKIKQTKRALEAFRESRPDYAYSIVQEVQKNIQDGLPEQLAIQKVVYEKGFLKSSVEIVWRDAKKKKKAMNEYAIRFFIEQARKNGIDLKKIRMMFKLNSRYFKKIKNVMLDEYLNRI